MLILSLCSMLVIRREEERLFSFPLQEEASAQIFSVQSSGKSGCSRERGGQTVREKVGETESEGSGVGHTHTNR